MTTTTTIKARALAFLERLTAWLERRQLERDARERLRSSDDDVLS